MACRRAGPGAAAVSGAATGEAGAHEEDVRLIRDSAGAVAPRDGGLGRVRALRFTEPGFDRAVWRTAAELGWLGLLVPAERGGSGLGMTACCALMEELGAGLVPEPLLPAMLAAPLLPTATLEPVLAGERIVLLASQERAGTFDAPPDATVRAGRVTGVKVLVPMAGGADAFLLTTRDGLALVTRDAPGVTLDLLRTQDGGHAGTLTLEDAPAELVPGNAGAVLEDAALATAAFLLGVMDAAFSMTLSYLKTRTQFGRPIGSFQALQHRAADLRLQIALTRAAVEGAAAAIDHDRSPRARAAVSRAKARAADASMLITRQCVQLHGGIGYTDEYDVGLFLRKAMVVANQYGTAALHRARFAALHPEDVE